MVETDEQMMDWSYLLVLTDESQSAGSTHGAELHLEQRRARLSLGFLDREKARLAGDVAPRQLNTSAGDRAPARGACV